MSFCNGKDGDHSACAASSSCNSTACKCTDVFESITCMAGIDHVEFNDSIKYATEMTAEVGSKHADVWIGANGGAVKRKSNRFMLRNGIWRLNLSRCKHMRQIAPMACSLASIVIMSDEASDGLKQCVEYHTLSQHAVALRASLDCMKKTYVFSMALFETLCDDFHNPDELERVLAKEDNQLVPSADFHVPLRSYIAELRADIAAMKQKKNGAAASSSSSSSSAASAASSR
jgi:hypothetical protein